MTEQDVVVVGAGSVGLSAGVALADRGVRALVVDREDAVGMSWRKRYDRLRLNSAHQMSHLPGRRFPKGTPTFPSRDEYVAHLETNAADAGFDLQLGTTVEGITHRDKRWRIETDSGGIDTRQVVIATGFDHTPIIPPWPGRETFNGTLLHAADYRNPKPFAGKDVLVVGPGCSGMEIAYDLAVGGAAQVWLAVRTPPNITLRAGPAGIPGDYFALPLMRLPTRVSDAIARVSRQMDLGDLSEWGLPVPEEGTFARLKRLNVAPSIVDREVIDAIKDRKFEIVRGVTAIEGDEVVLDGGVRLAPDAVICATGYKRNLEPLVGHLGVLAENGIPRRHGPDPVLPGLRFLGYQYGPAHLGHAAKQARRAARKIAKELREG
jgi:cation diffusion facilitator CzcD-associated flavoprotein CzcO